MIFRNNDIPQEYNNIAEISDNYLVWVRESSLVSGRDYNAYIQFLTPSFWVTFTDSYRISSGTDYEYVPHYTSGGAFSYVDYYDSSFTRTTLAVDSDDFSTNDFDRADMPLIFVCQFICCVFVVWMLDQLSKLVHKGGVFSG